VNSELGRGLNQSGMVGIARVVGDEGQLLAEIAHALELRPSRSRELVLTGAVEPRRFGRLSHRIGILLITSGFPIASVRHRRRRSSVRLGPNRMSRKGATPGVRTTSRRMTGMDREGGPPRVRVDRRSTVHVEGLCPENLTVFIGFHIRRFLRSSAVFCGLAAVQPQVVVTSRCAKLRIL